MKRRCIYKIIYLQMKITASPYMRGLIFFSFAFPVITLITTWEMVPMAIPSDMLYMKGMAMMAMKQGIASV